MATDKKKHTKKETPQLRTKRNKAALLKALVECRGIVTDACKAVGITRKYFYEYYNNDPEFRAEADDVQEVAIDFVEGRLFAQIEDDVPSSTMFYLKTKAKHRGYIERQEVSHQGEIPVAAKLSDEAKKKIDETLEDEY